MFVVLVGPPGYSEAGEGGGELPGEGVEGGWGELELCLLEVLARLVHSHLNLSVHLSTPWT